ncbi:MAG: Unknown protein [uncultured Sulfurovum sp.]|uniref:Uncharacterized protein n=1 Tax=uncultured Sulfurovum sp. TaxID=269237 RepID=A0A6S6SML0_9BACT|nr:MAG: Unknown protein [uncultured Sulfurovum sp.]
MKTDLLDYEKKIQNIIDNAIIIDAKKEAAIETIDGEVHLVLINAKQLLTLLDIENDISTHFEENGKKSKDPFFTFGKIINPSESAYKYSIKSKHSYKIMKDRSTILTKVEKHHDIWKNKQDKFLREKLNDVWESSQDKETFKKEFEANMLAAEKEYNDLLLNFSNYDVVISNYESYLYYPFLTYTLNNGKSKNTMLRQDVPNFLYYEEDPKRASKRSDSGMSEVIEKYHRICENIYFNPKK